MGRIGWKTAAIGCASVLVVSFSNTSPAHPRDPVPVIDRVEQDCNQIPPDEVPPPALSTSEKLGLQIRVMFEAGDKRVVSRHMDTTEVAFERIGIDVDVSYDRVRVPEEWGDQGGIFPDAGSAEHFELMKNRYGGERPEEVDVVYFFSRYWGGGMADCIGGVRFPDRAFAFGSVDYAVEGIVPVPTVDEGVIAAHEIGHLLGAHHHYSNCVEAPIQGALAGQPAACTTMSPSAIAASAFFGLLETSFVRHYTKKYAQG